MAMPQLQPLLRMKKLLLKVPLLKEILKFLQAYLLRLLAQECTNCLRLLIMKLETQDLKIKLNLE